MADPISPIDINNPSEIARETLRRLALRRIAPTPDNYQALYQEIAGMGRGNAGSSAAGALAGLVMDLSLHHPELAPDIEALDLAVRAADWGKCRRQISAITRQLRQAAAPGQSGEALATLRELLAKTLELGLAVQLAHAPTLAERAQALATRVRDANSAATLREAASGLKNLWIDIELNATQSEDRQETLKRILLLLIENIGELLDDDTWLRGQLDLVQDVIAGPTRIRDLQEAERRLKDIIYKQSLVKHGLREATSTLKAAMTAFVRRMGDAVNATGDYHERLADHVERIRQTEDVIELNRILETLLDEARAAQRGSQDAHAALLAEHDAALAAENRIRALEHQIAEMSALIREDPLTHSLNRRGLDDEFAREIARSERAGSPLSIAVVDLDNFKKLNDERGHQAGDQALVHLVNVTRETLRITDQIARLGGEEFLILLPNTSRDDAVQIIQRLQRNLTRRYFLDRNERLLITFSAGVAERTPGESQDALIARADAAMYAAKRAGKNQVHAAAVDDVQS